MLEKEVYGFRYWRFIRRTITEQVYRAASKVPFIDYVSDKQIPLGVLVIRGVKAFFQSFWYGLHCRPNMDIDVLVIQAPRKRKTDKGYCDDIMDPFLSDLGLHVCIWERSKSLEHQKSVIRPVVRFTDMLDCMQYLRYYCIEKIFHKTKVQREVRSWISDISHLLDCELDERFLINRVLYALSAWKCSEKRYERLYKKYKPKLLLLNTHYDTSAYIETYAAHKVGIPVVEMQHGIMGDLHIAYNYYDETQKYSAFLPDKILAFGKFWADTTQYPKAIIPTGFPHYDEEMKLFVKTPEEMAKNRDVLFLSGGESRVLADIALSLYPMIESVGYRIVFKLHPGEYREWRKIYPQLIDQTGVLVVDNGDRNLYAWMADACAQVGIYSTALYEGLGFGLRTMIVDEPRKEAVHFLLEKGYATVVHNAYEIFEKLLAANDIMQGTEYFWMPYAKKNVITEVHRTLEKSSVANGESMRDK